MRSAEALAAAPAAAEALAAAAAPPPPAAPSLAEAAPSLAAPPAAAPPPAPPPPPLVALPPLLSTPPLPVVALVGMAELHREVGAFLASLRPPVVSMGVPAASAPLLARLFGPHKGAPLASGRLPPPGILRADFVQKWRQRKAAVALCIAPAAQLLADPAPLLDSLRAVRAATAERAAGFVVLLVLEEDGGPVDGLPLEALLPLSRSLGDLDPRRGAGVRAQGPLPRLLPTARDAARPRRRRLSRCRHRPPARSLHPLRTQLRRFVLSSRRSELLASGSARAVALGRLGDAVREASASHYNQEFLRAQARLEEARQGGGCASLEARVRGPPPPPAVATRRSASPYTPPPPPPSPPPLPADAAPGCSPRPRPAPSPSWRVPSRRCSRLACSASSGRTGRPGSPSF